MNKYEHAESSAKIFGGEPKDYEAFHALIDFNKVVTPSIFGRFFLHHIDIGLPILEKVFGKAIGAKKVSAKHLLTQHLLEDYDQVITFEKHWKPALEESGKLPTLDNWNEFLEKARHDSRLKKLKENQLLELDDFFRLKTLLPKKASFNKDGVKDTRFAILGHALGGDLAVQLLGSKIYGFWTSDVVTGYLNCRFRWSERFRDPVPTLLDYERHVPDKPWMHAPEDYEDINRRNPMIIKKKIKEINKREEEHKDALNRIQNAANNAGFPYERRPCNLD